MPTLFNLSTHKLHYIVGGANKHEKLLASEVNYDYLNDNTIWMPTIPFVKGMSKLFTSQNVITTLLTVSVDMV